MDIDLVYLWVDGNDPQWLVRRNEFFGIQYSSDETNCKGRYANNDELKYSLRSVEKNIPWVRKIFIVTDGQIPEWLNTQNPKIQIVDHSQILPVEAMPCYNASVIECFLGRIPDLSEHFLFANDDMFANKQLTPDFFFSDDGLPIVRLKRKIFGKLRYFIKKSINKKLDTYRSLLYLSAQRIQSITGKYYTGIPHHNIDSYCKSDFNMVIDRFKDEVMVSQEHHIRHKDDFHRSAISYYVLATKRGWLKYVKKTESYRIPVHKPDFMKYIRRYNPQLFCLNDSQYANEKDRERIQPFLENMFPISSKFEK